MMNNKQEKVVWVFLDSQKRGLAVELSMALNGKPACPMMVKYMAYGIYDATNDRVIKWKLDALPDSELVATMHLMAANPQGRWIRGRSQLGALLVKAYTGEEPRIDKNMWLRIGVLDPNTGVILPEHVTMLNDYIIHPEDQPLVDAITNKNGVPA